jgi:5-methylcytosine-specific restriction endonuclease McrA
MATKDQIDKAWNNAKAVRGKDPKLYRQDPYGTIIYKRSYGKDSRMGWEVDHIKPIARGGSDAIRNVQALHTEKNREKSDSLVKKSRHSKTNK